MVSLLSLLEKLRELGFVAGKTTPDDEDAALKLLAWLDKQK